jgi:hypothetical protein
MTAIRYAAGILLAFVVAGYPFLALTYSTGAPSGFSGPEQNCSACHNDFPVDSGSGSVTITAPPVFTPGVPVLISVSVANTTPPDSVNRQGFELSTRDAAMTSTRVGTYVVDGITVQNAQGSPDFVTHTGTSNMGTVWTFEWLPPAVGSPPQVTMYAAGNAANGNGDSTGDYIYTTSVTLDRTTSAGEDGPDAAGLLLGPVSPNPVRGDAVVSITLARTLPVQAYLVDAAGRVVRTVLDAELAGGESFVRVNTRGLAAGAYVLRVVADGRQATRRLTVLR